MKKDKKEKRKYARIRRLGKDKYEVYFNFTKIPIIMNASYLSQLLRKNQLIIRSIFSPTVKDS